MSHAPGRGERSSTARRMSTLYCGAEPSPKSISVCGTEDRVLWFPVIGPP
jgi:hypothetical protein